MIGGARELFAKNTARGLLDRHPFVAHGTGEPKQLSAGVFEREHVAP